MTEVLIDWGVPRYLAKEQVEALLPDIGTVAFGIAGGAVTQIAFKSLSQRIGSLMAKEAIAAESSPLMEAVAAQLPEAKTYCLLALPTLDNSILPAAPKTLANQTARNAAAVGENNMAAAAADYNIYQANQNIQATIQNMLAQMDPASKLAASENLLHSMGRDGTVFKSFYDLRCHESASKSLPSWLETIVEPTSEVASNAKIELLSLRNYTGPANPFVFLC